MANAYIVKGFEYTFEPAFDESIKVRPIDVLCIEGHCFEICRNSEDNSISHITRLDDEGVAKWFNVWLRSEDITRAAKLLLDNENRKILKQEEQHREMKEHHEAALDILKDIINGGKENAQIEKDR